MSKESEHGKKTSSTSLLLDLLKEEDSLPDHLLSATSEVKKKRDSKKFFADIIFLSTIELIRFYREIIQILEAKAQEKLSNNTSNEIPLTHLLIKPSPTYVQPKEEMQRLQDTKDKYIHFIELIDAKISAVKQIIDAQRAVLVDLSQKAHTARNELVQEWNAMIGRNTADPDFQTIKIKLPISLDYQELKIDKKSYITLLQLVADMLKQGDIPSHKMFDVINEKANQLIEAKLNSDLMYMPHQSRQDAIQSHKSTALAELTHKLWQEISMNPALAQRLEEMHSVELAIAQAESKLTTCLETLDSLMHIREVAVNQLNEIDALLASTHPMITTEQVTSLNAMADSMQHQFKDLDTLLSGDLKQIDTLRKEADVVIGEIKEVKSQTDLDMLRQSSDELIEKYRPVATTVQEEAPEEKQGLTMKTK